MEGKGKKRASVKWCCCCCCWQKCQNSRLISHQCHYQHRNKCRQLRNSANRSPKETVKSATEKCTFRESSQVGESLPLSALHSTHTQDSLRGSRAKVHWNVPMSGHFLFSFSYFSFPFFLCNKTAANCREIWGPIWAAQPAFCTEASLCRYC